MEQKYEILNDKKEHDKNYFDGFFPADFADFFISQRHKDTVF